MYVEKSIGDKLINLLSESVDFVLKLIVLIIGRQQCDDGRHGGS